MQTVKHSWLMALNWGFTVVSFVYVTLFLATDTFNIFPSSIAEEWGATSLAAILCGAHLFYAIFIYPWFAKKAAWLATIIHLAVFAILFAAVIEASGRDNYVIRVGYVIFMFLTGMTGFIIPLAGVMITWTLYVFILLGSISSTPEETITTGIINIFVTLGGLIGWLVFRKFYINTSTDQEIRLANKLQEEQFKSNIIIESITDGIIIVNEKGTIQLINDAAANLIGWSKAEALQLDYRTILSVHTESEEDKDAITSSLSTRKAVQKTQLVITSDNHERYIDTVASPVIQIVDNKTGETQMVGVVAILRDVDKQKRQEQQRSDFISTASHEMRTPVASIQGFLELALNPKVSAIDDKARGYITKAYQSTLHLGNLFKDLLTISQNDDNRLQYNPRLVDLEQLVQQLFTEAKMAAEKAGLEAILDTGQGSISPLIHAHIDPDRFQEVFMNIFENAIKYTKVGTITVGLTTKDDYVTLRISDTGMGIAQEDIPHIFQKFYRTDNSETRAIGGTGLGLYIVQQLVTAMKGRITVESTVGAGSSFYITIPRITPEQMPKSSPSLTTQA